MTLKSRLQKPSTMIRLFAVSIILSVAATRLRGSGWEDLGDAGQGFFLALAIGCMVLFFRLRRRTGGTAAGC